MKRSAYILFLMIVSLMIEPLAPRQARELQRQATQTSTQPNRARDGRPHQSLTVAFDEGDFVLKDLRLVPVGGSTRLNGKLVNQTKRRWETIVFAVRAFDRTGKRLRGVEEETIFGFHQLARGKSAPINSGYGVWLEGIPFSAVARLEIVVLDDASPTAHANQHTPAVLIEE
ncbi:MAG TPA: hypothetical protein VF658_01220 [Pyrinomonadaceae bacterium]|jgi:hypothetical protein